MTACSQNFIAGFVNPNSDAALYQDALNQMNTLNWKKAISDIQSMSPPAQNTRTVMNTFAQALAGQCGFQMLSFITALSTAWSGGGTPSSILLTLMQSYHGVTINMAVPGAPTPPVATTDTYCSWSQQIMDNIQTTYGTWTSDEQSFVLFFSLAKIGMILNTTAGAGNTLNGSGKQIADVTFNACSTVSLPNFYAKQVTTGLALFLQYYTTISFLSNLNSSGVALPLIFCGALPYMAMNFCSHLTPAAVTTNDLYNVRGLITSATSSVGFNIITLLDKAYVPSQGTNPGGGIWQCTDGAYTPPGAEGLLNCCP